MFRGPGTRLKTLELEVPSRLDGVRTDGARTEGARVEGVFVEGARADGGRLPSIIVKAGLNAIGSCR